MNAVPMPWTEAPIRFAWRAVLILAPVTTLTLLGPPSSIRPLSAIVAFLVLPVVLLTDRRRLLADRAVRWLLAAAAVAVVGGAIALLVHRPDDLPGKATAAGQYVKAVVSLALGIGIYLLARNRLRTQADLLPAARWLLLGASACVALAFLQVLSLGPLAAIRPVIETLSRPFADYSSAQPYMGRGHGFTGEPSYLASFLLLILLPVGFALAARDVIAQVRLGVFAIAIAAAGCGIAGSRLGLLALPVLVSAGAVTLALTGRWRRALAIAAIAAAAAVAGWLPLRGNSYVHAPIAQPSVHEVNPQGSITCLGQALMDPSHDSSTGFPGPHATRSIGPRLAAATATIRVIQEHPLLGAGFGQSPLLLPARMPHWAHPYQEVQGWIAPGASGLATPMSLALRILAECGLIGLGLAFAAIIAHRPIAWNASVIAIAVVGGLALLVDSLTLATLALPSMWLLLAAICAPSEPPTDA